MLPLYRKKFPYAVVHKLFIHSFIGHNSLSIYCVLCTGPGSKKYTHIVYVVNSFWGLDDQTVAVFNDKSMPIEAYCLAK